MKSGMFHDILLLENSPRSVYITKQFPSNNENAQAHVICKTLSLIES